jgi:hypothetical protein
MMMITNAKYENYSRRFRANEIKIDKKLARGFARHTHTEKN